MDDRRLSQPVFYRKIDDKYDDSDFSFKGIRNSGLTLKVWDGMSEDDRVKLLRTVRKRVESLLEDTQGIVGRRSPNVHALLKNVRVGIQIATVNYISALRFKKRPADVEVIYDNLRAEVQTVFTWLLRAYASEVIPALVAETEREDAIREYRDNREQNRKDDLKIRDMAELLVENPFDPIEYKLRVQLTHTVYKQAGLDLRVGDRTFEQHMHYVVNNVMSRLLHEGEGGLLHTELQHARTAVLDPTASAHAVAMKVTSYIKLATAVVMVHTITIPHTKRPGSLHGMFDRIEWVAETANGPRGWKSANTSSEDEGDTEIMDIDIDAGVPRSTWRTDSPPPSPAPLVAPDTVARNALYGIQSSRERQQRRVGLDRARRSLSYEMDAMRVDDDADSDADGTDFM